VQRAVPSFAAVRARILARVPAARRSGETAERVAWPNAAAAEGAAWVARLNAAEGVAAARPDAEAAVAQPGVAEAEVAVQPGVAEAAAVQPDEVAGAELGAAEEPAAPGGPAVERPSGAAAWPSLPPFAARPRSMLTARAMGCSSVAWPTGQSWQATQFSGVSCALGPGGRFSSRGRGGDERRKCHQTLAMNKQALGRNVAGFKRELGFISRRCAVSTRRRSRCIQGPDQVASDVAGGGEVGP
jgi:hypothetical protein